MAVDMHDCQQTFHGNTKLSHIVQNGTSSEQQAGFLPEPRARLTNITSVSS